MLYDFSKTGEMFHLDIETNIKYNCIFNFYSYVTWLYNVLSY